MTLAGKTAFVTGGSGFIGGRLIEVLARQYGMRVKTLVRGTTGAGGGAFRAAAAGADIVFGSLTDRATLDAAVAGCDLVFHCAYGTHGSEADQRLVTVEGTRLLAQAAAAAGVANFVHLGTVASYGGNTPPVVTEDYVNPRLWPWSYAHDKLAAEGALRESANEGGMPFTILRLGMVYGPYGGSYTTGPLNAMTVGRLALVDDGRGVSCATYVDDVIQAMLLAADRTGEGETYMIRGPDLVTWREFYEVYDRWLGRDSLVSYSKAEMIAAGRGQWKAALRTLVPATLSALKASPAFRASAGGLPYVRPLYARFGKKLIGAQVAGAATAPEAPAERPVQLLPEMMIDYFANTTDFSIDKARSKLGYAPQFDLRRGMELTEQWARWANLVRNSGQ
ncbi:MAG: NAD-dependent epimerase/dehydratase family protein [Alteraurantiacibacter sp.]